MSYMKAFGHSLALTSTLFYTGCGGSSTNSGSRLGAAKSESPAAVKAADPALQVFKGTSVYDKKSVCTLTLQKNKDGQLVQVKLEGPSKNRDAGESIVPHSFVAVSAEYLEGPDDKNTVSTLSFEKQSSAKFLGFTRIAFMEEKLSDAGLKKMGASAAARILLRLSRTQSYIVAKGRYEKVTGYSEERTALQTTSDQIECENMQAVAKSSAGQ